MHLHLLQTPDMTPPPDFLLKEVYDTSLEIIIEEEEGQTTFVRGRHILVVGDPEDIKEWLSPYEGVWVGEGTPMEQHFTIMHIKKD